MIVEAVVPTACLFGMIPSPAFRRALRLYEIPARCDHAAALRPADLLFLQAEVRRWKSMQAHLGSIPDPQRKQSFAMA